MSKHILTEYKEKLEKVVAEFHEMQDNERFPEDGESELTTVFNESPMYEGEGEEMPDPLVSPVEDVVQFNENMDMEPQMEEPFMERIPGSDADVNMLQDDTVEEEVKETDWVTDRDVAKFMGFLEEAYPGGIPRHDGSSISGAERAMSYINALHKQISEAIRSDKKNELDTVVLDKYRVNFMKDMYTLKEHIKSLQTNVRKQHKKSELDKKSEMVKEGSIPIPTLVMTPFERAISGIIINSVISGGKPFEDVYEHLKAKYQLNDREELAIMQLVMDMGYPIFKDRGTYSTDADGYDGEKQGLDFIKNYFA